MARFGQWRPLGPTWDRQPALTADIICLHTMVGSLAGVDAMFHRNGYGGVFSHYGIGGAGESYQWQDTRFRAAANYNGNHRIISVETADIGPQFAAWNTNDGAAVPAWTDAQIDTLARLVAEMCTAHNIPCALIPDSKPGRRGVAYHRQGIDGTYPDGRVPGGEVWSTAKGKVCPGDRRIRQIPTVIDQARAIMRGDPAPLPAPPNTPEDDMFIRYRPDPAKPAIVALLSGPIFVGLGGAETASAEAAIKAGTATVLDVGKETWRELDKRSHALCDNPRPVVQTPPTPAPKTA